MEKLLIIKVGGNVIDDDKLFASFMKEFAAITSKKILVHGGGKIATEVGRKAGIEPVYVDGRRITNDDTIDLVTMVYGGLVNKKSVALLQSFGCNALGVTGADGNLIPAKRRPVKTIDYGWVGDPEAAAIPAKRWTQLINSGFVPVVAPLTHDTNGAILNTNADTIASVLATALSSDFDVSLIYCFEKKGILTNLSDETSVLKVLSRAVYEKLKTEQRLFAGILPKIDNAFVAVAAGVKFVLIGSSDDLLELIDHKAGTLITG